MEVFTVLLVILAAVVALVVHLYRRNLNFWKDRGIPHDPPHFFFGNFKGIGQTHTLGDITSSIYQKHRGSGPFCGVYFFQSPQVLLLDLELIKNVLIKDFSNFVDRRVFNNARDDPLTAHLFALDGEKWRTMRNKLSPTFTSGKMKVMFPKVVGVAEQFVDTLRAEMATSTNIIEIKELLARFTTDVIGTCAFGIECNSLKDPNAEFRLMGKACFTELRHGWIILSLVQAFPDLAVALHMRVIPDRIHNFFMRIVREAVEFREKHNVQRNDFLNLLMDINKSKKLSGENEALHGFTLEEMAAQAFVFFVAGFETSSSTMSFCLYELAQNQDIQERLREEVVEVLKRHNNEFTYECMKEMQYMEQVISETLRKYPIVADLNRQALNDYPVPGHPNYVIKKGTKIFVPVRGIHHDPLYYPDPEKFDPERFTPEKVKERDSALWLPFGDGPRNCIGMRFGQMQMRAGLTHLLKNFKFTICGKTKIPLEMNPQVFVLSTKDGIYLKVEEL